MDRPARPEGQPARRLPAPWKVVELEGSFAVEDAAGRRLVYVYWDSSALQSASSDKLTRDEARRIAANIGKLPELLRSSRPTSEP